jgi:hypothetical protein
MVSTRDNQLGEEMETYKENANHISDDEARREECRRWKKD